MLLMDQNQKGWLPSLPKVFVPIELWCVPMECA